MPLLDLPQHLALVSVLRHEGDPAWGFDRHFVVEHGELTPYWTYYLALRALSAGLPVETASRVYLSLYALAVPWVGIGLCAALRRPPWTGLLAAPLALDTNLYMGFVSYGTGVLLMLCLLGLVERQREEPRTGRAVVMALLAGVLFFTHVQPFGFLLLAAPVLVLSAPGPARRRIAALLPLLPATAFLLAPWVYWQFLGPRDVALARYNFGRVGQLGMRWSDFGENLAGLPAALSDVFQDGSDQWLLAAWAVVLLALAVQADRAPGWGGRRRPAWLLALALLLYFLAPLSITGQWDINPRFAVLLAWFAVPLLPDRLPRAALAASLLVSAAVGLNAAREHRAFDVEAGAFDRALQALPPRPVVLPLIYDERGGVLRCWPYLHFGQYAMVRRGGVVAHTLAESPPFPIRHRRPDDFPAPDPWRPGDFRFEEQGGAYDFFLVRSWRRAPADSFPAALPHLSPVFEDGEWSVWQRRSAAADTRSGAR